MSEGITAKEGILLGSLYPGTLILAIILSNTLANDNHMQSNNDTPTQDLFNAYHDAVGEVNRCAWRLYKRALYELEASLEYQIGCLEDDELRLCANGMRPEVLERMLGETLDSTEWTLEGYKAGAVYDGAEACGEAASFVSGHEDTHEQKAYAILFGKLGGHIDDLAQRLWDSRVEHGLVDA